MTIATELVNLVNTKEALRLKLGLSVAVPFGDYIEHLSPYTWSPSELYSPEVIGMWLEFSDTSKLYTDVSGTTQVAADQDPVGRVNDSSGNAINATQSDELIRPKYDANTETLVGSNTDILQVTLSGTVPYHTSVNTPYGYYYTTLQFGQQAVPYFKSTEIIAINRRFTQPEQKKLTFYYDTKRIHGVFTTEATSIGMSFTNDVGVSTVRLYDDLNNLTTVTHATTQQITTDVVTQPTTIVLNADVSRSRIINYAGNQLRGVIPDISAADALEELNCSGNLLYGTVPPVDGNVSLTTLNCSDNNLTEWASQSIPPSLVTMLLGANNFNEATVDLILSQTVAAGAVNGTLNLSNTTAPSATGQSDVLLLEAAGWVVVVDSGV